MDLLNPTLPFLREVHIPGLQNLALLFSALGSEPFYLLLLPLVYWLVDRRTGAQLGILLLASVLLNDLWKVALHLPRPFEVDRLLMPPPKGMERSFGFPSGHAQGAFLVWPFLALRTRNKRLWLPLALGLACSIAFSRMVLGVHWPIDVLGGALIGGGILLFHERFGAPVQRAFRGRSSTNQLLYAVIFVLLCGGLGAAFIGRAIQELGPTYPALVKAPADLVGRCAALLGLVIGLIFAPRDEVQNVAAKHKSTRLLVGMLGVAVFYFGLKGDPRLLPLGFARYFLTTFWVTCGALWAFRALGLSGTKREVVGV